MKPKKWGKLNTMSWTNSQRYYILKCSKYTFCWTDGLHWPWVWGVGNEAPGSWR